MDKKHVPLKSIMLILSKTMEALVRKTVDLLDQPTIGSFIFSGSSLESALSDGFGYTGRYAQPGCLWVVISGHEDCGFYIPEDQLSVVRLNQGSVIHIHITDHSQPVIVDEITTHLFIPRRKLAGVLKSVNMFRYTSRNSMSKICLALHLVKAQSLQPMVFKANNGSFYQEGLENYIRYCGYDPSEHRSLIGILAYGEKVTLGQAELAITEITDLAPRLEYVDIGFKQVSSLSPKTILIMVASCSNLLGKPELSA